MCNEYLPIEHTYKNCSCTECIKDERKHKTYYKNVVWLKRELQILFRTKKVSFQSNTNADNNNLIAFWHTVQYALY